MEEDGQPQSFGDTELGGSLGCAAILLALCLGIGSCHYLCNAHPDPAASPKIQGAPTPSPEQ